MATPVTIRNRETTFNAAHCRALARALIGQAFQDALSTSADEHDQRHARAFLTAPDGDWAWSRRFWSAIADLSHHDVRERAMLAIERGVDWHQVRRGALA